MFYSEYIYCLSVQASGKFRIENLFGPLYRTVVFNKDKKAWRILQILRSRLLYI